jgi:hypothetical protein
MKTLRWAAEPAASLKAMPAGLANASGSILILPAIVLTAAVANARANRQRQTASSFASSTTASLV